ncbi:MAG: DUF4177 domain-containing protein [Oscillospiraceae bacterium]|nr:DUF4177 domain-containing protein [Oscillospiraceae bacterium]
MYEYKYVSVEREGWIFAGFQGYREVIDREAADGWRFVSWMPLDVTSGAMTKIDLIFEREV